MATTTNYGWTTPDDTGLVKDGASAIRSLGTAIDTTVKSNADAAIAKTIVDAKGDLIAATAADTVSRLAVGTNGQVLTADSTAATGLAWAAAGGGSFTLLSTTTLSGATTTISSISGDYQAIYGRVYGLTTAASSYTYVAPNNDLGSAYCIKQRATNSSTIETTQVTAGPPYLASSTNPRNSDPENTFDFYFDNYTGSSSYGKRYWTKSFYRDSGNTFYCNYAENGGIIGLGAITSLVFGTGSTFSAGTVKLYGIK